VVSYINPEGLLPAIGYITWMAMVSHVVAVWWSLLLAMPSSGTLDQVYIDLLVL
jgi:hypothetical protein